MKWLEVSHDKFFIDNVTKEPLSISDYKSNYSKYLKLREKN